MAVTQLKPWGFGGGLAGDYSQKTEVGPEPPRTRALPFGFGGRRAGNFTKGEKAFTGQITQARPWGFGGRLGGNYSNKIVSDPTGTGTGNFALSGSTTVFRVLGDPGGPAFEFGNFSLTGVGLGSIASGTVVGTGSGNFELSGTGLGGAIATGDVVGTGSGNFALFGTGQAFTPIRTGTGSGNFELSGLGQAFMRVPGPGEFTLQDIRNVVFNEIIDGFTFESLIKLIAAATAGHIVHRDKAHPQDDDILDIWSVDGAKVRIVSRYERRNNNRIVIELDPD